MYHLRDRLSLAASKMTSRIFSIENATEFMFIQLHTVQNDGFRLNFDTILACESQLYAIDIACQITGVFSIFGIMPNRLKKRCGIFAVLVDCKDY